MTVGRDDERRAVIGGKMDQLSNEPSIQGSAHVSTSNIISYSLMTAATMLTFYFTFQGGLIAFAYPALFTALQGKSVLQIPAAGLAAILLAGVALTFHFWAYRVVETFIAYFFTFLTAGSALETAAVPALQGGIYTAMQKTSQSPGGHRQLYWCTLAFFVIVAVLWIFLAALPWVV